MGGPLRTATDGYSLQAVMDEGPGLVDVKSESSLKDMGQAAGGTDCEVQTLGGDYLIPGLGGHLRT